MKRVTYRCVFALIAGLIAQVPGFAQDGKSMAISLDKGNLLSIIEPKAIGTEESKQARKRYYDVAIDLAQSYGYRNRGALRVVETLVGKEAPTTFVLASWPTPEADAAFESHPEWQEYKALRPVIWETLRFYKAPVNEASELTFSEHKTYTISFVWLKEKGEGGFRQYQENIKDALEVAGGKPMYQMQTPRFDTHSAPFDGPDVITLIEWNNEEGYDMLMQSEAFADNRALFIDNTQKQGVYRIAPVIR